MEIGLKTSGIGSKLNSYWLGQVGGKTYGFRVQLGVFYEKAVWDKRARIRTFSGGVNRDMLIGVPTIPVEIPGSGDLSSPDFRV